jgi:hypothetical protein
MATIDFGKQMFDTYFGQVVNIATILLVQRKSKFFQFFDDVIIFSSILIPTVLRFFLTSHKYWGILIVILGVILIYFLYQFHFIKHNKTKKNDETKKKKTIFKRIRHSLSWLIKLPALIPLYITLYVFYLPLSVEVNDTSNNLASPFESPQKIYLFCLTKSSVIVACEVAYYIRLYIVWLSILICIVDFILDYAISKYKYYILMKLLSILRLLWMCIITLIPGIVFGILLSDENYYLTKVSSLLSITACVAIIKHFAEIDVHTFFSHYINNFRMFEVTLKNSKRLKKICKKLHIQEDIPDELKENEELVIKRRWVVNNIERNAKYICFIISKLKEKVKSNHEINVTLQEVKSMLKNKKEILSKLEDIDSEFKKEIASKVESEMCLDLVEKSISDPEEIIVSRLREIENDSNLKLNDLNTENKGETIEEVTVHDHDDEMFTKLKEGIIALKAFVFKFFDKLEEIEDYGFFQTLTKEDKEKINKNCDNIRKIKTYIKNHKELLKGGKIPL